MPLGYRPFENDFDGWIKSASFSEGHRRHLRQERVSRAGEVWTFEIVF